MIRKLIWLLLVGVFLLSAFVGSVDLSPKNIFHVNSLDAKIFFDLRLPRVLFTFFAGAVLAISGLLFQTLFRNALMTPYTLGISSGAVLGAGIAIKLSLGTLLFGFAAISIFGFLGALFTVFLLLYLAQFLRQSHAESLLLLGIALSLFYSAVLMVIFYLGSAIQNDMLIRFTMGSLSVIGWQYPLIISIAAIILFVFIYMYRFELQLLSVSSEQAQLKGVNTKKVTLILLIVSSFAIGILVSISGPIGFVGLIVPHIVHKLYPVNISKRIIKTTLFGGLFLVLCDTISRTMQTQSELPIGIITAIIGGPFFIYLIMGTSKKP
ncbi:FecCD family ABC transporter permease [Sulfurimonas autotrophica]|uniref:Transport system permease protein n=1 Tax=Sulfurimonas autotrophica (strain ATCC BAA-671 / DSM 16294 / JCM 11897 / OK10) TaxID=563040 RepID=E0USW3_SULAO|nr:iron ABC transporter permease [Sulfurimonas autotrophica]ADN08140.1 transport system permease protein [Sulfurimonas autotrophica DSM 16294]